VNASARLSSVGICIFQVECVVLYECVHEVVMNVDVFGTRMELVVGCECDRTLVVAVDGDRTCDGLVEFPDE